MELGDAIYCYAATTTPIGRKQGVHAAQCLFGLLGEKDGVDVGEDTAGGDGDATEELVELLVVLDGEGDVAGDDAALLVVAGGVAGELEDLGAEVLEDGGEVDGGTGTHAGGVLALTEVTADTADGELQTCLGRRAGGLLAAAASLSFSGHGYCSKLVDKS